MNNVMSRNAETVQGRVLRDQLVTLNDLEVFKADLLSAIGSLLNGHSAPAPKKWLKSYEVRAMLNISPGTLQTYRTNGILPYTRVGKIILYDREEIEQILASQKVSGR